MKKLATLLLTSALVGGLTFTAFAPAASAAGYNGNQRGNFANQQMQGQNIQGQQGQFGPGQGMRGPDGMRGQGFGAGVAAGGLVHFVCSVNGAPRLEIALNNLSDRLTLSDDQKTLYDAFKTSALTAQTAYADACELPSATATAPVNPVDLLKIHQTNETASIAAIDSVLPSLEAFYNSLTDAQKAELTVGPRANMQVGQNNFGPRQGINQRGNMGPGNMMPNQNNVAPGTGQGFGPGNGQGFRGGNNN